MGGEESANGFFVEFELLFEIEGARGDLQVA
jgi:hypothetical protein